MIDLDEVASELKNLIDFKNKVLRSRITSSDLDEPDFHDYQTCHELHQECTRITGLEAEVKRLKLAVAQAAYRGLDI